MKQQDGEAEERENRMKPMMQTAVGLTVVMLAAAAIAGGHTTAPAGHTTAPTGHSTTPTGHTAAPATHAKADAAEHKVFTNATFQVSTNSHGRLTEVTLLDATGGNYMVATNKLSEDTLQSILKCNGKPVDFKGEVTEVHGHATVAIVGTIKEAEEPRREKHTEKKAPLPATTTTHHTTK
jgi:hypothetical protein